MDKNLLQEQLDYYDARAREYDRSLQDVPDADEAVSRPESREWNQAVKALHALGPCGRVLELAGGTGLWSKELAQIASELTVLDGSPEMLEVNRAKLNDPKVNYEQVDLFEWEPKAKYDLVFFGFFLSHVPRELSASFLDKAAQSVMPGGYVFMVDEPANGKQLSGPATNGMYQQRTVQDGRIFNIVKIYYDPQEIQEQLMQRGFVSVDMQVGDYFFHLAARLEDNQN